MADSETDKEDTCHHKSTYVVHLRVFKDRASKNVQGYKRSGVLRRSVATGLSRVFFVFQFDLVCVNAWMLDLTQAILNLGFLAGAFTLGYAADR